MFSWKDWPLLQFLARIRKAHVTGTFAGKGKELPGRFAPLARLNSICPYFTMFPLQFPFEILKKAKRAIWFWTHSADAELAYMQRAC